MTQQERDEIRALVLSFSTKISDLPEVEALQEGDYVVVVQNDGSKKHSKKATLESLLELIKIYYPDHNGAKYQGVAHPSDTNVQVPVGTDGFWFAIDAGVYTNYGGIVVGNSPKIILYNVETHGWTDEELWGDINGTIKFRLKDSTAAHAWDTYRIPVVPNRDYLISVNTVPSGSLGSIVISEYHFDGTLIKTTELIQAELDFIPQTSTDYIKVTLGYNTSNPIDKDLSEVNVSSSVKTLIEGLYNFIVDVLQGEYETKFDRIESDITNIFSRLNIAENAITDLRTSVATLNNSLIALGLRLLAAEGNIEALQLLTTNLSTSLERLSTEVRTDLAALGLRVLALEGDYAAMQTLVGGLSTTVGGLASDVEGVQGDVLELSTRLEGTETSVTELETTTYLLGSRIYDAEGNISLLEQTSRRITMEVQNMQGDVGLLQLTATDLTARMTSAEGDVGQLQLTAEAFNVRMTNTEGSVGELQLTADEFNVRMSNAEGNISELRATADGLEVDVRNAEGDINELSITAEGLEQRVTNAEGDVHTLQSTATTLESQITATDGRVSTLRQTVDEIDARVENAEGDVAGLAIEAHRIDLYAQSISESLGDYEAYTNGIMRGLQDQLDGVVDTYFYDYMPVHEDATGAPDSQVPLIEITIEGVTVPCEPYASWYNTDHGGTAQEVNTERIKHLGDVFYDNKSGYAFRFSNTGTEENPVFAWVEITDSAVIKALADAARAQDTADHKRRVFVYSVAYPTPYAPYDVGDLWVKPVTVGTGASAQNTTELYRCITARERTTDVFPFNPAVNTDTTSEYCDWAPADSYGMIVNKANLEVMSNAIVGQVTQITYNADGTISDQSSSAIQQTAGQIRLQVANGAIDTAVTEGGKIAAPLLATGIDIVQGDITLIANHISLKNQSDITGLELITIGESPNQRVVIDVGSLNVSDIFTTSAWDNSSLVNPGVKQQLLASAAGTAEQMLGTALYGSGGTQQQPTGGVYKALNPITTALTENTTVIAGGLMMSTALVLGGLTGPDDSQGNPTWEPWSGMFGVYDPTVGAGGGVAAWYGGTNVDAFTIPNWDTMTDAQKAAAWSQYRYARTLFRMDGSGYLANGEISWSDQGSLVIHGASIESTVLENSVTFGSTQITIQDIIELKSWFVKESYIDGQGNTRYAIKLATGTAAGTIAGFYTDGFISAGGLSSGGGASGTTIEAVWGTLTNNTPVIPTTTTKIAPAHIPIGSGLEIQNGVIVVTAQGTVTGIKIGSTTYTPASGSTTVDISAGIPTVPTAVSAFTNDAGYITSSDIPSSWAWSTITNTPTTLSGYGITDATISNGVVTLGSSTITPVTGIAIGGSGHTNDLAITAGGSTSYVTVPFATTASKLSTVSKTAWGQTYWTSGGVPDSISGNMSSVGNITMTGSISGATTISASSSVTSPIFYLNANTYFVLDSSGYVHLVTPSGKGFYCDGFISAGGISTGGGTSGIDLAAMWASLQNNDIETTYDNYKIAAEHLVTTNTSETIGLIIGTGLSYNATTHILTATGTTYTAGTGIDITNSVISINSTYQGYFDTISDCLQSLQSQVDSVSTRDMFDDLYATTFFADQISGSNGYFGAIELNGSDLATINTGLGNRISTLEGYFDASGNAKKALQLTNARTLWGQSFDGTANVSGDMTDVGSITATGALTLTTTKRIYFGSTSYYIELDSNGYLHTNVGFYSDSFVSAGGLSTGGGTSGIDWSALAYPSNEQINITHLTDALAGYATTASLSNYLTTSAAASTYQTKYGFTITGTSGATYNLANFVTSSGVTSVATGTGLTGGTITSTGTISIDSTYQTYISNGNTAYGWGNHANAGYFLASNFTASNIATTLGSTYVANANYATSAGNSDTLDNYHASGLLTSLSSSSGSLSIGIGGATASSISISASTDSDGYNIASNMTTIGSALRSLQAQVDSVAARPYGPDEDLEMSISLLFNSVQAQIDSVSMKIQDFTANGFFDTLSVGAGIYAGSVLATGYITAGSASDMRLKDNIYPMNGEEAKRIVMALSPVTFTWNDKATSLCSEYKGNDWGFVAQQVQPIVPTAIGRFYDYLRLNQEKFIAPLVSVAQDHERRLTEIERKLNS